MTNARTQLLLRVIRTQTATIRLAVSHALVKRVIAGTERNVTTSTSAWRPPKFATPPSRIVMIKTALTSVNAKMGSRKT